MRLPVRTGKGAHEFFFRAFVVPVGDTLQLEKHHEAYDLYRRPPGDGCYRERGPGHDRRGRASPVLQGGVSGS